MGSIFEIAFSHFMSILYPILEHLFLVDIKNITKCVKFNISEARAML